MGVPFPMEVEGRSGRRGESDLEKMRESWPEWQRDRTTVKEEKSPTKSDIVDTGDERVCCCRCGVPLTPSTGREASTKAEVERKAKRRSVVSWQKRAHHPALSLVECFIVSRGCQLNEAGLARALGRAFGPETKVRVRTVSALDLVAEQARADADAVIVHVCGHDLIDASHSVSADGSNAAAVAGSVASVMLRQLGRLATRNGGASLILVSLPVSLSGATESGGGGKLDLFRRAAYDKLEAGCSGFGNVRLIDAGSAICKSGSSEAYISEAGHLTSAGIKKMVKMWSNKIGKILA